MTDEQKNTLLQAQFALYPALDDDALFAQLTTKDIPVKIAIPTVDIRSYLMVNDLWLPIKRGASDSAEIAQDAFTGFPAFRMYIPQVEQKLIQILTDLVDDPLIPSFTEPHKTAILAMGSSLVSWADENIPGLTTGDIIRARAA